MFYVLAPNMNIIGNIFQLSHILLHSPNVIIIFNYLTDINF